MSVMSVLTCVIYLCLIVLPAQVKSFKCPCSSMSGCTRQKPTADHDKEVFVVTNGTSDYHKWTWEDFTAVLVPEEYEKNELMCYTHNQKKQYGFIAKLNHADHFNKWSNITQKRIDEISALAQSKVVDMVAVNLIDVMINLKADEVNEFGEILFKIKKSLMPEIHKVMPVQMVCIVTWKPQCHDNNCNFTDQYVYHSCDLIMVDPSSYTVIEPSDACKARASVPFTHLALGVDEYAAKGIPQKRVILGIPWHGYKYTCNSYHYLPMGKSQCTLPMETNPSNNKTFCNYEGSRTKITIGEMRNQHPEIVTKSLWSNIYQAPVYEHFDNATKVFSQVWFENIMSLRLKYQYAHDFGLKGIAIYYAEDLSEANTPANKGFVGGMWDWVLHGILKTTVTQPPPVKYHADVVAGAAIGCLLLGLLLGILFTCLALRHRVKKNREVPFKRDQIEYHDEDDNLHL